MLKQDFDKLLLEAIDEGLTSLGESSKKAIYFHLEKRFNVKRHEIPCKTEVFINGIERIFGLGAAFLEILILKRLYEKIGEKITRYNFADFNFTECVVIAKRRFLWKKKAEKMVEELVQCEKALMES